MKKTMRKIVAPFYFILLVGAMSLFPGPLALMLGIVALIRNIFADEPEGWRELLIFTFAWITLPYFETSDFINGTKTYSII